MGFLSSFEAAARGEDDSRARPVSIAGKAVVCPHCGGTRFLEGKAQLNTAGMSFLNLDWLNRSVTVLECAHCGRIQWFA
ncbi:hypothetical protein HMPREF1008_00586 [Olsenella sp. oral taxon 809 str. F0356]|uniref:hypothetical protein n=1 Tax=Olsenella sp. oral taxon 809 TaxID=661086 RepID=UPI000231EC99|nr:hypothetical protein [Olsenella sp. oral taxon 809]EHF02941.1 hypothetical protein HMPREF1008_00586 [Olsenella sp. oral taxon 809 str. F0356]